MVTRPDQPRLRPVRTPAMVDLPQPLFPRMAVSFPFGMRQLTSRSTTRRRYPAESLRIVISAPPPGVAGFRELSVESNTQTQRPISRRSPPESFCSRNRRPLIRIRSRSSA